MDPILGSALIGGAFSGVNSLIGGISGSANNKKALAQQQNQFNQMMNWNKYVLDSTREREDNAYQRQANDMKLAGINPLMAGLQGGSASGGGIMPLPNGVDYLGFANSQNDAIANALNTATGGVADAVAKYQEGEKIQNDKTRIFNETIRNGVEMASIMKDIDVKEVQILAEYSGIDLRNAQIDKIQSEIHKVGSELETLAKQRERLEAEIKEINQSIGESKSRVETQKLERRLKETEMSQKQLMDEFYTSIKELTDGNDISVNGMMDILAGAVLGAPLAGAVKGTAGKIRKGAQVLGQKLKGKKGVTATPRMKINRTPQPREYTLRDGSMKRRYN